MKSNSKVNSDIDFIVGTLIGGACGDAYGMPYEGLSAKDVKSILDPKNVYIDSTISWITNGLSRGSITDDTQLTFATVDSILEKKTVDIEDIGKKFVELYKNKTLVGAGQKTKFALKKILKGVSAYESGMVDGYGCGAAMRISPIALLPLDGREMENMVADVTYITHYNSVALSSAMAINGIVAHLLGGKNSVDKDSGKDRLLRYIEHWSDYKSPNENFDFQNKITYLKNNFDKKIDVLSEEIGTSGLATESVVFAIASFLKEPRDFEKLMYQSVRNGGDTDSIASMAGNMFGAYNGFSNIPNKFVINLNGKDELIYKAKQFAKLVSE